MVSLFGANQTMIANMLAHLQWSLDARDPCALVNDCGH